MSVGRLHSEFDILSGGIDITQDIYNRNVSFGFVKNMS